VRTSDALCRATSPRERAPSRASKVRRTRPAGPAAGLGRTDTERIRAPSIGSTRTSRPEQATSRSLFTCTASPRTLSPATSRARLVKGWTVASGYPTARAPRGLPLGSRRRRERCVSPTSATNLRYEHPLDCPIPERSARPVPSRARFRALPIHLRSMTSSGSRVKLRLTANLQLRRYPGVQVFDLVTGLLARTLLKTGTKRCAVLAEPRSRAPPRGATRQRSSRPRTEPMA